MKPILPFALPLTLLICAPALAAESGNRIETDGGDIILQVAADPSGTLRGALTFDLKPGWKTYWRDPGASGIPPTISVADPTGAVQSVAIAYPPPHWIEASYGDWAGYSQPVAFPLTFEAGALPKAGDVTLSVFAGICAEVCIPVAGTVRAPYSLATSDARATVAVENAFSALPGDPDDTLSITAVESQPDGTLTVAIAGSAVVEQGNGIDLFAHAFIAGNGRTLSLKRPVMTAAGSGKAVFALQTARAVKDDMDVTLHLTVEAGGIAVAQDFETRLKAAQ